MGIGVLEVDDESTTDKTELGVVKKKSQRRDYGCRKYKEISKECGRRYRLLVVCNR